MGTWLGLGFGIWAVLLDFLFLGLLRVFVAGTAVLFACAAAAFAASFEASKRLSGVGDRAE